MAEERRHRPRDLPRPEDFEVNPVATAAGGATMVMATMGLELRKQEAYPGQDELYSIQYICFSSQIPCSFAS